MTILEIFLYAYGISFAILAVAFCGYSWAKCSEYGSWEITLFDLFMIVSPLNTFVFCQLAMDVLEYISTSLIEACFGKMNEVVLFRYIKRQG
jgi:hypothetical protein